MPRSIPRSYALDAVLELLALPSNSTFYRSGLAGCIAHYPPGVYDAEAVEEWARRLARRLRLVRLARAVTPPASDDTPGESRGLLFVASP